MLAFLMFLPVVGASSNHGQLLRTAQVTAQYPVCTSCPDNADGCDEETPYMDITLQECVAFCTGDEVPQALGTQPGNKTCASCPPAADSTLVYADHEAHICVDTCPPGKAPNEKMACAVCKPPFSYADHVNKKCVAKCPPGKVPDTLGGNDCKECGDEFPYADHERHACVKQCGPGKVGDRNLKECRTCEAGKYANHKTHSCDDNCPEDHPYKDSLDCVMTCSEGKVPNPSGNGDPSVCSYCPPGKFADHALHACVDSCSSGYTPDPDGTLAPEYKNDCKRCPAGKFADHTAKACTEDCPIGTKKNKAKRNCDVGSASTSIDASDSASAGCTSTCASACASTCASTCVSACVNTDPTTCASTCASTCGTTCGSTCASTCAGGSGSATAGPPSMTTNDA